ncbi:sliding clamp [uncultured Caudovirales phage]|uniref:Sliding clamp n=1 Tax=uncultured Caudovirales phage TaxID=2100421 RepID=A0A6J5KZB4_9CAUD|nr:sliding clamp [uncultured Caudovirales phage]
MKLSKPTVALLKNFATINSNILLKAGSSLQTISGMKAIVASVTVEEVFPQDFGIYDLNDFLSSYSMFNDAELTFSDKFVKMSEGNSVTRYYASSPEVLTTPKKAITFPEADVTFNLSTDLLASIMKSSSVLRAPDVSFIGEEGTLSLLVTDKKNPTANSYEVTVGKTESVFNVNLKVENLKFIPGDYVVSISSKKISRFQSTVGDLVYFVAVEADSTFA